MENIENVLCGFILFLDKSMLGKLLVSSTNVAESLF